MQRYYHVVHASLKRSPADKLGMGFFRNGGTATVEEELERSVRRDASWCFLRVEREYPVSLKAGETNSGLSAKGNYHSRKQAERDLNPTPDAPLHLIKVERIDRVIWAALVHPCALTHLRFTFCSLIRAWRSGERKQIWHCESEDGPMLPRIRFVAPLYWVAALVFPDYSLLALAPARGRRCHRDRYPWHIMRRRPF